VTATMLSTADVAIDSVGRFPTLRKIGQGGSCEVYRGHDNLTERHIAIKCLMPEYLDDQFQRRRLETEATILESIDHPNIVRLLWSDTVHAMIGLELLDGPSLAVFAQASTHWTLEQVATIGYQVCLALEAIHVLGIIHRDIKPGNIILDANHLAKVIDFSIASAPQLVEDFDPAESVMGTAPYFSPEQACGLEMTTASDVFSLGIVLFELLTGRSPFPISEDALNGQEDRVDLSLKRATAIAKQEPRSLLEHRPDAAPMETLIAWMLEKDPNQRPNASKVSLALTRWLDRAQLIQRKAA
jgi:serine/threonine protein kinase